MNYEVEICDLKRILKALFSVPESCQIPFPSKWVSTVTGRAAMLHVLTYLRKTGVLENKNALFLVPQWVCISFLQLMRKYCSPTLSNSKNVKAALVYHQYGFPQDMDEILDYCDRKKIIVIEDCANIFEGYYKNKRLGTLGFASIFSLSKIFPSIWGAGLATTDEELYEHAISETEKLHSASISFLLYLTRYFIDKRRDRNYRGFWNTLSLMVYGVAEYAQKMNLISKKIICEQLKQGALKKRYNNYIFVLNYFKNYPYFQYLEKEGVIPYVVPLIASEDWLYKISNILMEYGYTSGIYHFDVNRNLFNPNFVKCAWVPVHQGLSSENMNEICDLISSIRD